MEGLLGILELGERQLSRPTQQSGTSPSAILGTLSSGCQSLRQNPQEPRFAPRLIRFTSHLHQHDEYLLLERSAQGDVEECSGSFHSPVLGGYLGSTPQRLQSIGWVLAASDLPFVDFDHLLRRLGQLGQPLQQILHL